VQVRATDTAGRDFDDGIVRVLDLWNIGFLDADLVWSVIEQRFHLFTHGCDCRALSDTLIWVLSVRRKYLKMERESREEEQSGQ
jgi:hypothetical protein